MSPHDLDKGRLILRYRDEACQYESDAGAQDLSATLILATIL
jgi:hypothetical protein